MRTSHSSSSKYCTFFYNSPFDNKTHHPRPNQPAALQQTNKTHNMQYNNSRRHISLISVAKITQKPNQICEIFRTALDLWSEGWALNKPSGASLWILLRGNRGVQRGNNNLFEIQYKYFSQTVQYQLRETKWQTSRNTGHPCGWRGEGRCCTGTREEK